MPLPGCRTLLYSKCDPFDPMYMPKEGLYDGLPVHLMPDPDRDTLLWIIAQSRLDMETFTQTRPLVVHRSSEPRHYTFQLVDGYHRLWVARMFNAPTIHIEIQETDDDAPTAP